MCRWILPLLASLLVAVSASALTATPGDTTFKGKKVQWTDAPRSQLLTRDPAHPINDVINIGGQSFPTVIGDGRLRVSTVPDGTPTTAVTAGSSATFSWTRDGAKHNVQLRFTQDDTGAWQCHAANGWEYKIGGEMLRLVDANMDGRFDSFDDDGCTTYGSGLMLPLAKDFVLGSKHVQISSIAPDGAIIVASVTPLKASPGEVAVLVKFNRWRSANGLGPASFDPTLCRNCTAHATYLRLHHWSGETNPHSEEVGSEGATPEGRSAAERSVICRGSAAVTLDSFLNTYYHRIPLMSAALEQIGLNENPGDFTVIDVSQGIDKPWPTAAGFACPIFFPAPGAVGVPTNGVSELPKDPVSNLSSRGFPLMALFDTRETTIKDFGGKLFERRGAKNIDVPVLIADPGDFPFARGIVPELPLKGKTRYRAVFTYAVRGKACSKVVDFETG